MCACCGICPCPSRGRTSDTGDHIKPAHSSVPCVRTSRPVRKTNASTHEGVVVVIAALIVCVGGGGKKEKSHYQLVCRQIGAGQPREPADTSLHSDVNVTPPEAATRSRRCNTAPHTPKERAYPRCCNTAPHTPKERAYPRVHQWYEGLPCVIDGGSCKINRK